MIGFIKFWVKRIFDGNKPLVIAEDYQSIEYLAKTGWKPDYNFLRGAFNKKQKGEYMKKFGVVLTLLLAVCLWIMVVPARAQTSAQNATMQDCFNWYLIDIYGDAQGPCEVPGFVMAPNGVCLPAEQIETYVREMSAYCHSMEPYFYMQWAVEQCLNYPDICSALPAGGWLLYLISTWPWP